MEPARSIIEKLGGEAAVSNKLGVSYTAPYRWQHPREKGGCDGIIPQKRVPALIAFAKELGVDLDAADFLPRTEAVS